jgi:hypothetical protein
MNSIPTIESGPVQTKTPELSAIFVAFHFKGKDNGVPKEGYDSRVIKIPQGIQLSTAEDLKEIADALATSAFNEDRRYEGLEITIFNLVRLPV